MSGIQTTASRLRRAVELGRRIRAVRDTAGLWRLSRSAWTRQAMTLGDFTKPVKEIWAQLEYHPALRSEIAIRASLDVTNALPHPAPHPLVFSERNPDPSIWPSMLHTGLDCDACSALAALRAAEMRHPDSWGSADSVDETAGDGALALRPLLAELAELDAQLAGTLKLADLAWVNDRPVIRVGGIELPVTAGTVAGIATAIAEPVQLKACEVAGEAA